VAGPRFVLSKLADVVALVVETGAKRGSVLLRLQHHYSRAHLHPAVEIDHILIGQPDAAR
jgi:hypothetical protein